MILYIVLGIAILVGVLLVVFVWKPWESKDEDKKPEARIPFVQGDDFPEMEIPVIPPYTGSVPEDDRPVIVPSPVEPIDPKTLPGLVGLYLATSYDEAAGVWKDVSGKNNHTSKVRGRPKLNTSGPFPYVYGGTADGLQFPQPAILPYGNPGSEEHPLKSYTLMYVAKYNGPTRGRIFDGLAWNWLSGFHGSVGLALHENATWLIGNNGKHCDDCGLATPVTPEDINPNNWLLGTDMLNMYRANGIRRGWGTTNGNSRGLGLNYGWYTGLWRDAVNQRLAEGKTDWGDSDPGIMQASDWAVAEIVVFDRELGEDEVKGVEMYLYEKTRGGT